MPNLLNGRKIIITGVSRGIGYETAKLFLKEGAQIIGSGRDGKRLETAVKDLKQYGDITAVEADLAKPGFEKSIVTEVQKKWGSLDILINNAGVQLAYGGFLEEKEGDLENTVQVNLYAPYHLVRAMVPFLLKETEPRIINVSSGAGSFEGLQAYDIASYRISKWALNGFTMIISNELNGKIAVNSFDPGWVKTDMGGKNAPGFPADSAKGVLALAVLPFDKTGKFWKDGHEIQY